MSDKLDPKQIFLAALEQNSPADLQGYLDEACGGNAEVRARVDALLRAHRDAGNFLGGPPPLNLPLDEGPGATIGPYKLLEQIGEGGFGVVFMAEQKEPIRRKVALKVLKPGMDTKEVIARFEAERQALALMDHAHIAHILDGGVTASGRPYVVMELVRGVPITDFCDRDQLSVLQRLELFVSVCQAVEHAHQKGVIHRDLKPSNILVTLHEGAPVAKVIDFGIAKALGQKLTDKTLTGFATMIGTPLYMSPEQAEMSGLDVDTRSDVYALGVLLYELLTGTTPHDAQRLRTVAYDEVRRIIREEEPSSPSMRISTLGPAAATMSATRKSDPGRLSQLVRGELDWIVMKALEKDRNSRYQTVNELAMDLQRYLRNEPVQACPASAWYRFRKFARRNRGSLLTVSLLALALVAGTVFSCWQAIRATWAEARENEARREAIANLQMAREAVDKMFTQVAEKWLAEQPGLEALQRQFLEEALRFYEGFAKERSTEPVLRLEAAKAQCRVGLIQQKLGEYARSEQPLNRAIALLERLVAEFPSEGKYRFTLADNHDNLGASLYMRGRPGEAAKEYRQALLVREKLVAQYPEDADYRQSLADSYAYLGHVQTFSGVQVGVREGAESLRRAVSILEDLPTDLARTQEYRRRLASCRVTLGLALNMGGRAQEAEKSLRQAVALYEKLATDLPSPFNRHLLATALIHFATALDEPPPHEAEQAIRSALAAEQKLATDFPAVPVYRSHTAFCHIGLGRLLQETGRIHEAEEAFRQAAQLFAKLIVECPTVPDYQEHRLDASHRLSHLLLEDGRIQEAEESLREALEVQERLQAQFPGIPQYRNILALSHHYLGQLLAEARRPQEAEKAYHQAGAGWEKLVAEFPKEGTYRAWLANHHNNLAELFANCPEAKYWDPVRAIQHAKKGP
jgi:serine/threonine protein kinase